MLVTKLDEIMREKDITDGDMETITGLPRMTIFNARRGKNITMKNAQLIAQALKVSLDQIWPINQVFEENQVA